MGDKFDLGNAHISGSAIGNRATVNNYAAAPDALLQALLERRPALLGDAPAAGRDDVRARLDEIEAQLRSGQADREVVRTGLAAHRRRGRCAQRAGHGGHQAHCQVPGLSRPDVRGRASHGHERMLVR
jgi:hypothetical protein